MTVSTQRLNITQAWQQVATGNVTLIGCNTSASYHIYVGNDTPNDKSAFVTDKLAHTTEYNFNAPVWVKLNVNNQIDDADLIVMGEAVVPKPTVTPLTFNNLQNCTYPNDTLIYTSGNLDITGSAGYQAWGNYKNTNVTLPYNATAYLLIGDSNNFDDYQGAVSQGYQVVLNNGILIVFNDSGQPISGIDLDLSQGDLSIVLSDSKLILTNTTTGQTWTSPQSDYLTTPKYLGVVVNGTAPLTIKAI